MTSLFVCSLLTFVVQGQTSEIDKLIQQLGTPKFAERQEAARRLEAIGEPAVDALRKAAKKNPDAEIRRRAEALLSGMGQFPRPQAAFAPQQGILQAPIAPPPLGAKNGLAARWRNAYAEWQKGTRRTEDALSVIAEVVQMWSQGMPGFSSSAAADETQALLSATMQMLEGKRTTTRP
jgi:hypothetical protein